MSQGQTDVDPPLPDPIMDALFAALYGAASDRANGIERLVAAHPEFATAIAAHVTRAASNSESPQPDQPEAVARFAHFRIERFLGQGGMGAVHLAHDEKLDRKVALKLIRSERLRVPEAIERFRREVRAVARLDHPGICKVYEAGEWRGQPFMALQFLAGETLAARIAAASAAQTRTPAPQSPRSSTSTGPSTWPDLMRVVQTIEQVALALHHAHEQGLVHRDVKPGNVMITDDGAPVLLDFGLVRDEVAGDRELTASHVAMGTPPYMSPEQIEGRSPVDRRTDIYSLGVTMFECLTLRRPFDASTDDDLRRKILAGDRPHPRALNRHLGRDLCVVLGKAMDVDPGRRYRTAAAMAADLRAVLERRPIQARSTSTWVRVGRWMQREPLQAVLGAVLAIGVPAVAGLGGYVLASQDELAAGAETLRTRKFEDLLAEGHASLAVEDFDAARRDFERALTLQPDSWDPVLGLVLVKKNIEPVAAVLTWFERWLEGRKLTDAMTRLHAILVRRAGDGDKAASLEAALGAPRDADDFFVVSIAQMKPEMQDTEQDRKMAQAAFDAATQAVLRAPVLRAKLHYHRAGCAGALAQPALRAEIADTLELLWPDSPLTCFYVGYLTVGVDLARAERSYRRALVLRPDWAIVHSNLAVLFKTTKHMAEAEREAREAIRLGLQRPGPHSLLGGVLTDQGRLDEAVRSYEAALAIDPNYLVARENLGALFMQLERHVDAIVHYRHVVRIAPERQGAWLNLGICHQIGRDPSAAVEALAKAVELNPNDAVAWGLLSRSRLGAGRTDALAAAERALELDPEQETALSTRAFLRLQQGSPDAFAGAAVDTFKAWRNRLFPAGQSASAPSGPVKR